MHILMDKLYRELVKAHKIFIYGAGGYANMIYPLLKKAGLHDRISSFVVSDLYSIDNIDGIEIKPVHKIDWQIEDSIVLVAVSEDYENEIIQTLHEYQTGRILKLTDYVVSEDKLKSCSDEQFLDWIIEGHVWRAINSLEQYSMQKNQILEKLEERNDRIIDKKTIIYITEFLKPRTIKIIRALTKKNFNVIVLLRTYFLENLVMGDLLALNVKVIPCDDSMAIYAKAIQYKPLVYFYEPEWGNCIWTEIMIKHKNIFGKIVFSSYDVLNDGYVQITENKKLSERFCLENADGVVWRWFSKEFLEKEKKFVYKGKSIQFLDYCNKYDYKKRESQDAVLKLCCVGGNLIEVINEERCRNEGEYIEYARFDTIMRAIGKRQDCIFHLYTGMHTKNIHEEKLCELEKEYPNFKIFYGIKHSELIGRIEEYDYGCLWYTEGKDVPELSSVDGYIWGSTLANATTNKYFDYLEAGIPVIAIRPKKLCDYLNELGVLVKMRITDLNIDYLKENKKKYKENVEKARAQILIDNQINRLIDFFEEL